jgi:hypothetical protein
MLIKKRNKEDIKNTQVFKRFSIIDFKSKQIRVKKINKITFLFVRLNECSMMEKTLYIGVDFC